MGFGDGIAKALRVRRRYVFGIPIEETGAFHLDARARPAGVQRGHGGLRPLAFEEGQLEGFELTALDDAQAIEVVSHTRAIPLLDLDARELELAILERAVARTERTPGFPVEPEYPVSAHLEVVDILIELERDMSPGRAPLVCESVNQDEGAARRRVWSGEEVDGPNAERRDT